MGLSNSPPRWRNAGWGQPFSSPSARTVPSKRSQMYVTYKITVLGTGIRKVEILFEK